MSDVHGRAERDVAALVATGPGPTGGAVPASTRPAVEGTLTVADRAPR